MNVVLQPFDRVHSRSALDRQQSGGSMIIVWHSDIDERTSELDTEQTLAGSKRSRENVIFERRLFTRSESTSMQGSRMDPVHTPIGEARTILTPGLERGDLPLRRH